MRYGLCQQWVEKIKNQHFYEAFSNNSALICIESESEETILKLLAWVVNILKFEKP